MASEGLLGFIKGVSDTLVDEYKNINSEQADIRKENRAEQRAIAAEKRRTLAEQAAARYRKNLDIEYLAPEAKAKAAATKGLIDENLHPELMLDDARKARELERIRGEQDPTLAREEASARQETQRILKLDDPAVARADALARSEAARIRYGADMDPEAARLAAGTDAAKTQATEEARLKAQREDDRLRAEQGLPRKGRTEVDVSFSVSEATTQLRNDLSALHDIDLATTRERMADPRQGGSRLSALRDGNESLGEILSDPGTAAQLRDEIALKLHNATEKRLKEAANRKEITSLDQVTQLSEVIATRADQTITSLQQAQKMISSGQPADSVLPQLRSALASAYGEPGEESKQTVAFRSMWSSFSKALNSGR